MIVTNQMFSNITIDYFFFHKKRKRGEKLICGITKRINVVSFD